MKEKLISESRFTCESGDVFAVKLIKNMPESETDLGAKPYSLVCTNNGIIFGNIQTAVTRDKAIEMYKQLAGAFLLLSYNAYES